MGNYSQALADYNTSLNLNPTYNTVIKSLKELNQRLELSQWFFSKSKNGKKSSKFTRRQTLYIHLEFPNATKRFVKFELFLDGQSKAVYTHETSLHKKEEIVALKLSKAVEKIGISPKKYSVKLSIGNIPKGQYSLLIKD